MDFSKRWESLKANKSFQRALRGTVGHVMAMLFVVWEPLSFPGSCLLPIIHLIIAGVGATEPQLGATIHCCISLIWGAIIGALASVAILAATGPYKLVSVTAMLIFGIFLNILKLSPSVSLFAINGNLALANIVIKAPEEWLNLEKAWDLAMPFVASSIMASIIAILTALTIFPTFAESDLQMDLAKSVDSIGAMLTDFSSRMLSKGGKGEHAAVTYTEAEFLSRIGANSHRNKSTQERASQAKGQLLRRVNVGFLRLNSLLGNLAYEPRSSSLDEWRPIIEKSKVLLDHVFVLLMSLDGFSARQCSDETMEHWWGSMRNTWETNFGLCAANIHVVSELVSTLHRNTMDEDAHDRLLLHLKQLCDSIQELVGSVRKGFLESFQNNIRKHNYLDDPTPPFELRILYFTTFYYGRTRAAILDLAKEILNYHQRQRNQVPSLCDRLFGTRYQQLVEMNEVRVDRTPSARVSKRKKKPVYTIDLIKEPFVAWKRVFSLFPKDYAEFKRVMRQEKVRYMIKHTIALGIILIPMYILPKEAQEHMQAWFGSWSYVTVILVFQRAVESTFFKGLLRVAATILGAVIGGLYLLSESAASEPLLICTFLAPWIFLGLYFCQGRFHYGAFIFVITITLVIGCQYNADGSTPDWRYPASRCTSIIGGCMVAWFVSQSFWPFWGADAVRNKMAKAMILIGELYTVILSNYESGHSTDDQERIQDEEYTQDLVHEIASLLDQAQELNSKDTAAWTRFSLMTLPQEYKTFLEYQRLLLIYLQVLQSVISRDPVLTGKYIGSTDKIYMSPLVDQMTEMKDLFVRACDLMASIVRPVPSTGFALHFDHYLQKPINFKSVIPLRNLMSDFKEARKRMVVAINQRRLEVLESWAEKLSEQDRRLEEEAKGQSDIRVIRPSGSRVPFHADDSLRFFAYLYAKSATLDTLFDAAQQLFDADQKLSPVSQRNPPASPSDEASK
eukprot:TRINITY_DN17334_c0_g1_i1.p1 TRINITY_DN17334_c0_g1~~TRINITY_DN17334_c0_g1_i1.p1  ORF type:complete len:962 (-),score=167.53 TRINITY_DN17334_c0_g1_i1:81-2966(-)